MAMRFTRKYLRGAHEKTNQTKRETIHQLITTQADDY